MISAGNIGREEVNSAEELAFFLLMMITKENDIGLPISATSMLNHQIYTSSLLC